MSAESLTLAAFTLGRGMDFDTACKEFGHLLRLDGPVDGTVLTAALENEEYARNLLTSRRDARTLRLLLDNPPERTSERPSIPPLVLARRAAMALVRWAGTGFATAEGDVLVRRRAACKGCPNRRPNKGESLGVCGLCGCPLGRKTRMASEVCPGRDPVHPDLTRWGDRR